MRDEARARSFSVASMSHAIPPSRCRTAVVAAVAATGAIALSSCGGDGEVAARDANPAAGTHDERLAGEQVATFLFAMEASDDARACATMTPALRKAITTELRIESEPGTCHTRAADVYSPAKAPGNAEATLKEIRVAGNRATAIVTANPTSELATGPVESVVVLRRRENRWLIANF